MHSQEAISTLVLPLGIALKLRECCVGSVMMVTCENFLKLPKGLTEPISKPTTMAKKTIRYTSLRVALGFSTAVLLFSELQYAVITIPAEFDNASNWIIHPSFLPSGTYESPAAELRKQGPPSFENPWANMNRDREGIRKWGCKRIETPLIFVHIGKSGGGSIRARLAASSHNYTKGQQWDKTDGSYFSLGVNNNNSNDSDSIARFCSSCAPNHMLTDERSFEGSVPCHASTPLGHAIACPNTVIGPKGRPSMSERTHGRCDIYSETCQVVYAGHNYFGSEMHWLPGPYLEKWWKQHWATRDNTDDQVTPLWKKLRRNETWCEVKNMEFPKNYLVYNRVYEECSKPMQADVDTRAMGAVAKKLQIKNQEDLAVWTWAPVYASLPVLRVTVVRDPFAWLMSKYPWGIKGRNQTINCHDFQDAFHAGRPYNVSHVGMNLIFPGWAWKMSLGYIISLCGEDCMVRYAAGTATLDDLERQAEQNLRHGFAVVGLLDNVDTFYEMVSARVGYIDTSRNPEVTGHKHNSMDNREIRKCKNLFLNARVQERLLRESPELAALHRLYKVAVEVNRFQLDELRTCSSLPLGRDIAEKLILNESSTPHQNHQ